MLPRVDDAERDDRDLCNLPLNEDEEDQSYDSENKEADDRCGLS